MVQVDLLVSTLFFLLIWVALLETRAILRGRSGRRKTA
jgi:hypothetical protein